MSSSENKTFVLEYYERVVSEGRLEELPTTSIMICQQTDRAGPPASK